MQHIPFPDIAQFRNVVKLVRERADHLGVPVPTISFVGSVKLHGTNASIVFPENGEYYCQSRSQILSATQDNNGFAKWVAANEKLFEPLQNSGLVVFGEWCGQGIQKGVAISQVPKMFVVFAVRKISEGEWATPAEIACSIPIRLPSIYDYSGWQIDIDFNHPEDSQNKLVELTNGVEAECPVGRAFGVKGVGEGIVWWAQPHPSFPTDDLIFKVKGEKHSESKVKTLAEVDVEKINNIKELVEKILTRHRLEKKLDSLKESGLSLDLKNTGAFLKLVGQDIHKEEGDTILASGLPEKEVMGAVQREAKNFWMEAVK
jgi:hypothetical protein